MRPEIDFAGRQIPGSRETQDDYYGFCPLTAAADEVDGLLLVLADGMGGYKGGSTASRVVVESFTEHFRLARGLIPERLLGALLACRQSLLEEIARRDESFGQMGSTLVGVVWTAQGLQWVSVGDSGLYVYRRGTVLRINADHSMAPLIQAEVVRGNITAEVAAHHPDRHALRSAIAARPLEVYELHDELFVFQPGDIVFAATDGLASVSPEGLEHNLQSHRDQTAAEIATALLAAVHETRKPRQDNTTVAVIRPS